MNGSDDTFKGPKSRPRHPPSSAEAKERLARALRENLQKRKAQARAQEEARAPKKPEG